MAEVALEEPTATTTLRQMLRRLNADTSWLLQVPVIDGQRTKGDAAGTPTYNIVVDPWLAPSRQVDYHPLFSAQTRGEEASYASLSALSQALSHHTLEASARERTQGGARTEDGGGKADDDDNDVDRDTAAIKGNRIDAILISHPFTDHAHPETLWDLPQVQSGPIDIFCTKQSHKAVTALLDKRRGGAKESFRLRLLDILDEEFDDRTRDGSLTTLLSHQQDGLPQGLRLLRLPAKESWTYGPAWADLHSAVALVWRNPLGRTSSIVYSPHGTLAKSIPDVLATADARVLIQSFDRQSLPFFALMTGPVALGYEAALSCYDGKYGNSSIVVGADPQSTARLYRPTMLLRTHDEHKEARGLVGRIISRSSASVEDVQREVRRRRKDVQGADSKDAERFDVTVRDLEVGQSAAVN